MLVRFATVASVASLALLFACGESENPPASAKPTSGSTASKTEPASKSEPMSKADPMKSEPTKVTPTAKASTTKPELPDPEKPVSKTTAPSSTIPPEPSSTAKAPVIPPTPPASTTPSETASSEKSTCSTPTTKPTTTKPAAPESSIAAKEPATGAASATESKLVERAVAHVTGVGTSGVSGTISFRRVALGLEVHVVLDGLKPGDHGIHVHEKGDCAGMGAMTAGDHFNPGNAPHGSRESSQRHAGDFGNVTADAAGHVDATFTDTHVALSGETSILGRAIVVHSEKDDGMSQPSGNSGERVGCGVIEEDKGTTAGG